MRWNQKLPNILTIFGAVGVGLTAVSAVKTTKENPNATWKEYIPSITLGLTTIGCIISANMLNRRQQAMMASAYALLERTYRRYRKTATGIYGDTADLTIQRAVMDETRAQTRIR